MKCDFHCHTFFSFDSNSSPKEMVEAAIKKGIDCLAITDHNEIKGALEAIELAKGKKILIVPGIEIKTKEGDIIGLNLKEKVEAKNAKEAIKEIKKRGGFVILPHPFGFFVSFKGNLKEILGEIDAIEVLNGAIFGNGNKKAKKFAEKWNLPFVAGSDAHSPKFIGKCWFEVKGENLKIEEIFKKIKEKKVKIGGREANFFENLIDHGKRNLIKILNYAFRKKRKI